MTILTQRASDVRIQEINMSQVITSASTSICAQVIVSSQGDTAIQRWTNAQDYLNMYGNPNAQVSFDIYCGLDYFKEGNDLFALRVVGDGAMYSALLMYKDGEDTKFLPVGVEDPEQPEWADITPAGGEAVALFYPNKGPGSYGNTVALSVQSNNIESPTSLTLDSATTGGTIVPGTYQYTISAIASTGETLASAPQVLVIANGGTTTNVIELSWDEVPLALGYRIYGRVNDEDAGLIIQVGQGVRTFIDTGAILPDVDQQPITDPANLPAADPSFTISVFDTTQSRSYSVEAFTCTLLPSTDGDGAATELTERINPFSQYIRVTSNVASLDPIPAITSVVQTLMTGGDSGSAPTSFQIAAAYARFRDTQLYPINLVINAGRGDPNIQRSIDELCQGRGDAVGLLDVPSNMQQFQQAINYRNLELNLNSTYSALFCPDQLEADNINGKQQYVPFSGWAAALCARTDRVANPSFSPAGLNRGLVGVLKSRYTYDDGQASALFRAQVNYTRTFVGQGIALWEQQTLAAQQSALSWLQVRRIVNVMKVAIYKFLLYSLQEPNDEFTGRQIVSACTDYLTAIQNARGISSFTVVSDRSNNTDAMINSAIRKVTIIIVPVLAIHEIEVDMVISKEGVSFDETLRTLTGNPGV